MTPRGGALVGPSRRRGAWHRALSLSVATALLSLAGCDEACVRNSDCAGALICLGGACMMPVSDAGGDADSDAAVRDGGGDGGGLDGGAGDGSLDAASVDAAMDSGDAAMDAASVDAAMDAADAPPDTGADAGIDAAASDAMAPIDAGGSDAAGMDAR